MVLKLRKKAAVGSLPVVEIPGTLKNRELKTRLACWASDKDLDKKIKLSPSPILFMIQKLISRIWEWEISMLTCETTEKFCLSKFHFTWILSTE